MKSATNTEMYILFDKEADASLKAIDGEGLNEDIWVEIRCRTSPEHQECGYTSEAVAAVSDRSALNFF